MEEKNYRVLRIEEQLYGCEELPEGQPVLCDVLLEAADGTQRVLPYPDAELTRLDINEGSTVTLQDHRLTKAVHKVYFTRHGETVWNVENKICGMTDSPLTEKGRAQARELGEKLRTSGLRIDEILYSPLSRAADTDKTYLLVAHNGIARVVQSYFYDMTNEEYAAAGIKNCEFVEFTF